MIEKEKINHIASLAKLEIEDAEIEKYQQQITDILTEIEKIVKVEIPEENIMIGPSDSRDRYEEDIIGTHISRDLAFKNAKKVKGDYIVVPKVIE